jgi:cysteine synthase
MMNEFRGILEHIGRTPLVPLRRLAAGLPVPVLVKCEHMNPGGSVKDRIALAIVADAEARGLLAPGATLIEATAGNTGVGLALVAAARGYKLVCVMPEKMSVDKRVALATLGAQVIITPNAPPSSADNFRNVARRLAEERGWFLTDQFCNPANVRVHAETTAVEILEQTGGLTDEESFAVALRLIREEGLLVGGSAGTNVAAALRVAARGDIDGPVVTLLPDAWDRYRTKPWMRAWAAA